MQFDQVIARHYSHEIQMSLGQVHAIISGIAMAGPGCKLLVFGCGNDSDLWFHANAGGKTVFLENNAGWLEQTKAKFPHLDIRLIDYGKRTGAESLPIDEKKLASFDLPEVLREETWDVIIIIDLPMGYSRKARSLPIYWTSLVARPSTQVFVDNYERDLEREYADHFLNASRTWRAVVPRLVKEGRKSDGSMLWSMGTGAREAAPPVVGADRGAVIFLLDSAYLPGFRTLAYSIRKALAEGTHDIVIMSNDPDLGTDSVARHFADRIIILSDEELLRIREVNASEVDADFLHSEFGKFTFLKFNIFQDIGYAYHIFLDVDMICLDEDFSFNDLTGAYDFAAAPTMGSKFLEWSDDGLPDEETRNRVFRRIGKLMRSRRPLARSFNSGVIFVGGSMLGKSSVERLIAIGASKAYALEQTITHRFVTTMPGIRFESLSPGCNFTYHAALTIGEDRFWSLRNRIKFLHFNGKRKPWEVAGEANWIERIWLETAAKAREWHRQAGRL